MLERLVFLLMACLLASLQPAYAQSGRIEFDSFTPRTMFDLARERRANWEPVKAWGELTLPRGSSGPVPAMVLMHGSGGVTPAQKQWVEAFKEAGVATFEVNTFAPRGISDTIGNQARLNEAAHVVDAFRALEVLAGHPGIDPKRIGIIGFSRGGSATFRTTVEPLRSAVIKSDLRFALHIPVYAGCNQVYWSPRLTGAPVLNLVGEADDYTTAAPCVRLAERYRAAGVPIQTIVYAGAHHAWDALVPVTWLAQATTASPCGVVRWDIESWRITAEATDTPLEGAGVGSYLAGCSKLGVHIGRNQAAFAKSRADVLAFIKAEFWK